jgi:hypothetical protein
MEIQNMKDEKVRRVASLFDHLNQITAVQDPNYWSKLSDEDRKTWSNFMVHRFLSMNYDFIELIAELQPLTQTLAPELFYKLLINVIPKGKVYLRYIKGKYEETTDKQIVDLIAVEYSCSNNTAIDYYDILMNIKGGKEYIQYLREKYGMTEEKKKKGKK